MKVYIISEENHGILGVAKTKKAAKQWLIDSSWVCENCEIWIPEEQNSIPVKELHEDWKNWFINESYAEDLENMGFWIAEEVLIE